MPRNVNDIIRELPAARRRTIEKRAATLIEDRLRPQQPALSGPDQAELTAAPTEPSKQGKPHQHSSHRKKSHT
jgi:hypothetical protein